MLKQSDFVRHEEMFSGHETCGNLKDRIRSNSGHGDVLLSSVGIAGQLDAERWA